MTDVDTYAAIVTKTLVETLPAADRAAFYSAAFEVIAAVRRAVAEEQERELGVAPTDADDLAQRAAERMRDVSPIGWACTITGPSPRCRPILRRNKAA